MKLILYIMIIALSFLSVTNICFSADQWSAHLDELAKEEGIEYSKGLKSFGMVIFKLLTAGALFVTISGFGKSSSLYSIRGISGAIISLSYLLISFLYDDAFLKALGHLIKGLAIIIGALFIYAIFSQNKRKKPNKTLE